MQWLQILNIRKTQFIMPYTLRYSMLEMLHMLWFLPMMFSTQLRIRQYFMEEQEFLENIFILKSKKNISLST